MITSSLFLHVHFGLEMVRTGLLRILCLFGTIRSVCFAYTTHRQVSERRLVLKIFFATFMTLFFLPAILQPGFTMDPCTFLCFLPGCQWGIGTRFWFSTDLLDVHLYDMRTSQIETLYIFIYTHYIYIYPGEFVAEIPQNIRISIGICHCIKTIPLSP